MILFLSIVIFVKHSNLFNFLQYSTSGWFILVHRNDIAVAKSGCPLCKIHSSLMTTEWKVSSLLPFSSLIFTNVNSQLALGDIPTYKKSSLNYCTASIMYYFVLIAVLLFLRFLIFIPKKVFVLPFVTVNTGKTSSTLLMMLSISSCSACETLLSSKY